MKNIRNIFSTIITVCIVTKDVFGQTNPNYVYYNSNLDVYRKPDVHILAKAITAQNELAMTKLAYLGMLQPPGFVVFTLFKSAIFLR